VVAGKCHPTTPPATSPSATWPLFRRHGAWFLRAAQNVDFLWVNDFAEIYNRSAGTDAVCRTSNLTARKKAWGGFQRSQPPKEQAKFCDHCGQSWRKWAGGQEQNHRSESAGQPGAKVTFPPPDDYPDPA
jgi:hypothetical protein